MKCIPSSHLDCAFDKVQTPPLLKSNCVSKKKIKHGITNPLSLSLSLSLSPPPTPPPNTAVPHPQGYKSCRPGGCFFCYKQFKVKTDKCIMYYVLCIIRGRTNTYSPQVLRAWYARWLFPRHSDGHRGPIEILR